MAAVAQLLQAPGAGGRAPASDQPNAFSSAWETDESNRMMKGFLARRKR